MTKSLQGRGLLRRVGKKKCTVHWYIVKVDWYRKNSIYVQVGVRTGIRFLMFSKSWNGFSSFPPGDPLASSINQPRSCSCPLCLIVRIVGGPLEERTVHSKNGGLWTKSEVESR